MLNTRCELIARDSAYKFRLVTLNEVSWSLKINGNFRHNNIAIYDLTANLFSFLVTSMTLVTMISSMQKKCLLSIYCVDISS